MCLPTLQLGYQKKILVHLLDIGLLGADSLMYLRRLLADSTGTLCPSSLEKVERDFLRPVSQTSSDECGCSLC